MAITALSILIPTYNDLCVTLVDDLRQQAEEAGIDFEILVGDDGSTNTEVIEKNQKINDWPHCHYLRQAQNIGRAAIRNFLAKEAHYAWLLFIDSDMNMARVDYLSKYLTMEGAEVIDGGVIIGGDADTLKGNLRYLYEKTSEQEHTAEKRQQHPYHDFHTANFLIRRDLMLAHPFDERFRHYGYEDVLFGKQLRANGIKITHIDNPLGFSTFEENSQFILKTEEGLQTLYQFHADLRGYSRLLTLVEGIHLPIILNLIRCCHKLFGKWERKNLCGSHPSLRLFKLYKLGYYLNITQ